MSHEPFILGAYIVTAIVIVVEIVAVRWRLRSAAAAADDAGHPKTLDEAAR